MGAKSIFLTNHALVLIHIAENPRATLKEIARGSRLTERTVYKIVSDLQTDQYIVKRKEGRRNAYSVNEQIILGHRLVGSLTMAQLISALGALAAALQRRPETRRG